jgi:hypothetical protein
MNRAPLPPSRFYLLPAAAAVLLGLFALLHHLRQPSFPALPGRGCIVSTLPSPDSLYLPTPYLELSACLHISETILQLVYHPSPDTTSDVLFEATVEEDPRHWAEATSVRWRGADTVQVGYRADVRFSVRDTTFLGGGVVYIPRH